MSERKYAASLSINGLPMMGVVGKEGSQVVAPVSDLWASYCAWFDRHVAEGRPCCMLSKHAVWTFNGRVIARPSAWFITLEI